MLYYTILYYTILYLTILYIYIYIVYTYSRYIYIYVLYYILCYTIPGASPFEGPTKIYRDSDDQIIREIRKSITITITITITVTTKRGRDEWGFHRRAANPLYVVNICKVLSYVVTFCTHVPIHVDHGESFRWPDHQGHPQMMMIRDTTWYA